MGRGANLDTIDQVLNDRLWLERRFEAIAQARQRAGAAGRDRRDRRTGPIPVPGGFYDDLGDPAPAAAPGPRLVVRRRPGLVPRPDDRV